MSLYYECTSLSVVAQLLHSDSSLRRQGERDGVDVGGHYSGRNHADNGTRGNNDGPCRSAESNVPRMQERFDDDGRRPDAETNQRNGWSFVSLFVP